MQKTTIYVIAAVFLLSPVAAMAADGATTTATISLDFMASSDNDNSAKFQEYRDMSSGVYGDVEAAYYLDDYSVEFEASKIGRDDQSYMLKGGQFDSFTYELYYDETPHNLSFEDRTFYTGIGSNMLSVAPTAITSLPSTWTPFSYDIKRKKVGAGFSISRRSPYLFGVKVSHETIEGVTPLGSGGFGGATEMPSPVDYTNNDGSMKLAYRSKDLTVQLTGSVSSFDNENGYLKWYDTFAGGTDVNPLAPDNDYGTVGFDLAWRKLPMASSLAVNSSYSWLQNDFNISDIGIGSLTDLNSNSFSGDVSLINASIIYASRPMDKLDTRVYYKYRERNNDSTVIRYLDEGALTDNSSYLLEYEKHDAGVDASYALAHRTTLSGGYEFTNTDRTNRPDGDTTTDNSVSLQLRNSSLDFMSAKLQYKFLDRNADFNVKDPTATMTEEEYIEHYVDRYDTADKIQNQVKVSLDFYPADTWDVGLEYTYEKNDYDEVVLGRTDDSRHRVYLDGTWRISSMINVGAYAGFERTYANSNHFNFTAGSGATLVNPTVNDGVSSSYRWSQDVTGDLWSFGVNGKVKIIPDLLTLKVSYDFEDSSGDSDFTTQGTTALESFPVYNDYTRHTVNAKLDYAVDKHWNVALGCMYERFKYDDLAFNGYEYLPSGTALSGAYADSTYDETVGYLTLSYKF